MVLSWQRALKVSRLWLVATFPVFLYYYHHVLNYHARAQTIYAIAMSEFSVCTFTAFLWLAVDDPVSAYGRSGSLCIWDFDIGFVSVDVRLLRRWELWLSCKTLFLTWPSVTWPTVVVLTPIGSNVCPHGFPMISTWVKCPILPCVMRRGPVAVMQMANLVVIEVYTLLLFFLYQGTTFPFRYSGTGAYLVVWVSRIRGPSSDGPLEVSEIGSLDAFAAEVEGESYWDHSNLTNDLDLGQQASIRGAYVQLREVCPTANLSRATSAVYHICLASVAS